MLCPWTKLGQEKDLAAGVDLAWEREGRRRGEGEEGREKREGVGMKAEVHVMCGGS